MKTIVVSGGTTGIGEALAHHYLGRGDQVVVIGSDPAKGMRFLDRADQAGSRDRAFFMLADLSLISENTRVIGEIAAQFPVVDVLVLCARYFRSYRTVTREGFEHNFALYYLSRYVLGYGLIDQLEKADRPVIMNIAGPGVGPGHVQWDDLALERGYDGWAAMFQGGKLNDLLGVSFAADHRRHRTRYVLLFPGGTRTGFAGEFDPPTAAYVEEMKRMAQPVAEAVGPIARIIDAPPSAPLSAFVEGRQISLQLPSFDKDEATRLDAITRELLRNQTALDM
ncbi:oxidoreductase [Kibdelosporangium aridum]|uniref:Oxidoreductase n=1 Tax=Kibdelosporangium aridum TaxID=2030 RepID=A0A428ZCI8_KIBAR|nr:SDR family NAD(P)-dependent oxidoreductase [Kibdelosporangium aridum]RSM85688.1 oxidoreductase [Kibdelosporangium aridum]